MKFTTYLKDKLFSIVAYTISVLLIIMLLIAFKTPRHLNISIISIITIFYIITFAIDYFRKNNFYKDLLSNIDNLEKAYLVLETLTKPSFYEGELLYQALYEINKSFCEAITLLESQTQDFKEYIEMWIHEVKIPISSLVLMAHNHSDKFDKKSIEQIRRIEDYVDQVLYYVRSENAEKDYLIKETKLSKIISNVALKNKNDLLENKIDLIVENLDLKIYTDSKWLEFILNQIINNSIKYHNKDNSYIKIYTDNKDKDLINLIIEDNGIGIESYDLPRVFNKTFTGNNGRNVSKSTGMGLFIAENLCIKLGHKISIDSKVNDYTKVTISFYKNNFYDVIKNKN